MRTTVAAALFAVCLLLPGCRFFERDTSETPPAPDPVISVDEQEDMLADAEAAREIGDYQTALALFREILARNPTVTTAYLGIGDIYMEQGNAAQAEPNFARAARLEPRNFEAQFKHGNALQLLKRYAEAIRAYHRALVIRPDSAEANLSIATTYIEMGEPDSARVFAEKAVDLAPEDGAARVNLGAVYDKLGMWDEAIETYRAALELTEPTPEIIMNLVKALGEAERYREMIDAAETLNRMQPHANAYERIGYGWFKLRDYGQSRAAYERAVEIDPDNWPSWNGIGCNAVNQWLLSKKQDAEAKAEAGQALRRSLRINPDQRSVIELVTTYQL
jgi:tetratricopeptide (TPR) repeat protein